jgi:hypothetical protein
MLRVFINMFEIVMFITMESHMVTQALVLVLVMMLIEQDEVVTWNLMEIPGVVNKVLILFVDPESIVSVWVSMIRW